MPRLAIALALAATALTPATAHADPSPTTVTLQDEVYFGSGWQMLDKIAPGVPMPLGAGYANPQVIRSSDGSFFAGVIEKHDAQGVLTDVILTFSGATGADAVQGEAVLLGIPLDEAPAAAALYQQLLDDPATAHARIHVTGHSLGAGYAEYVCAYALATQGVAATEARADFIAFGVPNWQQSAALHFGLAARALDGHFTGYTAINDPVRVNGVLSAGIDVVLPAYDGAQVFLLNPIGAHSPTTYMSALGMPAWMDSATRALVVAETAAGNGSPLYGTGYATPGPQPLTIRGDGAADRIAGLDGNDAITGGGGADTLTGGGGADRFVYAAPGDSGTGAGTFDRITDFAPAQGDRIDLSAIDARPDLLLRQPFVFMPGGNLTGPGQVTSWSDGTGSWVAVSIAGTVPAMLIRLDGAAPPTAADFIL
jgi:hypothetical protein